MFGLERFLKRKPQQEVVIEIQVPYPDEKSSFGGENGICGFNKYDLENAVQLGVVKTGDKINLVVEARGVPSQVLQGRTYRGFMKSTDGHAVRHNFTSGSEKEEKFEQFSWQIKGWTKVEEIKEAVAAK